MSNIQNNIRYLRIRHTGASQGSIYLSDIDIEVNHFQPYKIPVYVPEGGEIKIPLNDQVLLSYVQGNIRTFINLNYITVTVLENTGDSAVWVSVLGDDNNPGTRSAPFRSIAKAQEVLSNEVGPNALKIVNLMYDGELPRWYEPIFINSPNWHFRGEGAGSGISEDARVQLYVDPDRLDPLTPEGVEDTYPIIVTNLTREAYTDLMAAGGVDYVTDGDGILSYSGPDLANLETVEYPENFTQLVPGQVQTLRFNCTFENISIITRSANSGNTLGALCLTAPDQNLPGTLIQGSGIKFKDMYIDTNAQGGYSGKLGRVFLQNVREVILENMTASAPSSDLTGYIALNCADVSILNPYAFGNTANKLILSVSEDTSQGSVKYSNGVYPIMAPELSGTFTEIDLQSDKVAALNGVSFDPLNLISTGNFTVRGTFPLKGTYGSVKRVEGENFLISSDANHAVSTLVCNNNFTKSGTGLIEIKSLSVAQNVEISAGDNVISSGTINGDLTVYGGANIDFTGVVVLGDVNLTGAGTVVWRGGSYYGTLTDPSNKLEGQVAGSYLGAPAQQGPVVPTNLEYHTMRIVLDAAGLTSIDLDHLIIPDSLILAVGRVRAHLDEDFELTEVGGVSRLTWIGSLQGGGTEALVEGDTVFLNYAYIL